MFWKTHSNVAILDFEQDIKILPQSIAKYYTSKRCSSTVTHAFVAQRHACILQEALPGKLFSWQIVLDFDMIAATQLTYWE